MQVVRIYTGSDGEAHLEDLELPYEKIEEAERTAMQSTTGIQFRRTPPGSFQRLAQCPATPVRDYAGRPDGNRPRRRHQAHLQPR